MRTLTETVARKRHPLVVRWELVTDAHGRTRPEMRWVLETESSTGQRGTTLAA
jgi:hypothetical protein